MLKTLIALHITASVTGQTPSKGKLYFALIHRVNVPVFRGKKPKLMSVYILPLGRSIAQLLSKFSAMFGAVSEVFFFFTS
uniref:Putative secreted protein n=1 Tax=Ixodes ricinus TaxID=34613 RepID=A0A6B0TXS1_IXORI